MSSLPSNDAVITWKHIGLYGYAVGTLAFYQDVIVWKSALLGRNETAHGAGGGGGATSVDDISTATTRKLLATKLSRATWTAMGKNVGLLRLAIANHHLNATDSTATNSNKSSSAGAYQQDWRLDGFPATDLEILKNKLQTLYHLDLQIGNMAALGTQYGMPSIQSKWLTLSHCMLQDDLNEEGQEFEVVTTDPICHLDLNEITQCVIPGNNRNEIELQFPETDTIEAGTDQLGTFVFSYVGVCWLVYVGCFII
jgi:hypothetical protein